MPFKSILQLAQLMTCVIYELNRNQTKPFTCQEKHKKLTGIPELSFLMLMWTKEPGEVCLWRAQSWRRWYFTWKQHFKPLNAVSQSQK